MKATTKTRLALAVPSALILGQGGAVADPLTDIARHQRSPDRIVASTNDVGCQEILIPYQINGGSPGTFTYHWIRPDTLHPEGLTNAELDECGLDQRPAAAMPGTTAYTAWLLLIHKERAQAPDDIWKKEITVGKVEEGPGPPPPPLDRKKTTGQDAPSPYITQDY